ncbi:MAG TPA: alcohol dehydrogenase catalytic domain-containing protein [Anaeromyxobacteraceae bacterium]|nr:alcohol dehydrogenase catalytic domain-containing protein [Anaeromyxobacteraceae bacterium]
MDTGQKTMRVATWYNNRDIRIEEKPLCRPGPGEMLVKVMACGICGSDIVEWYRLPRAPLVQGHELGATVVETGATVTRFAPGDRVFIAPKVPCHECKYCRDGHFPQCTGVKERLPGGFSEYILVPKVLVDRGAFRLPPLMTFEQATFIEPLACVVRCQSIAGLCAGQSVLILGCGMSGLLQVQLAKHKGCRVVATDLDPTRLARAGALGADLGVLAQDDVPKVTREFFKGRADAVIVCTAALPAVEQAWASADTGGSIVFFAVPGPDKQVTIPINSFWTREMRVLTSYYCGPDDIEESMRLLAAHAIEVDSLVTHRLPLTQIADGFRMVLEGKVAIKVIVEPHGLARQNPEPS